MSAVLAAVRARFDEHFGGPAVAATVTFLGTEPIEILRYGPDPDGVHHYATLGCSRHPMTDPAEFVADPQAGPRAEVVLALRGATPDGLARRLAVVAAAPAVEGLVLSADALVDLQEPLWAGAAFTALVLGASALPDVEAPGAGEPVRIFTVTPITPTEAAWVRLKGAPAMREAWDTDGVDVRDPHRRAVGPI